MNPQHKEALDKLEAVLTRTTIGELLKMMEENVAETKGKLRFVDEFEGVKSRMGYLIMGLCSPFCQNDAEVTELSALFTQRFCPELFKAVTE